MVVKISTTSSNLGHHRHPRKIARMGSSGESGDISQDISNISSQIFQRSFLEVIVIENGIGIREEWD